MVKFGSRRTNGGAQKFLSNKVLKHSCGCNLQIQFRLLASLHFFLEFRFHLGSVGDLILISVGAEFKRCLFVGQTKYNKTFKPYYDSNNVVVFNDDGSPAGTRILAPIPSWFRDPKEIKKIEHQANKIGWDVQMSKVLAICPQFV